MGGEGGRGRGGGLVYLCRGSFRMENDVGFRFFLFFFFFVFFFSFL